MSVDPAVIYVLAGVNGAGKSSIGENTFASMGSRVFNPDTVAQEIRRLHPDISLALANGHAWQVGRSLLEQAISEGRDYRFETTLGGRTIPALLETAVREGHRLHLWFCGLANVELHLERVRTRVARGGHGIPEEKIRERWNRSRENLIRLLPLIEHLRVYDNSVDADPFAGKAPQPILVLEMKNGRIVAPADLGHAPEWAQPVMAAAIRVHRQ